MTTPDPTLPSQNIPPDEVIQALISGIVRIRRRVEIYESNGTTPWDVERWDARLVSGDITIDRTRDERRMIDLMLDNDDGALELDPIDGFWYDKVLKAFWGIYYVDSLGVQRIWETQVGEFMIDQISEDVFPNLVKVTGRDYSKKCIISQLKSSMQFPQNTAIETIIAALAANAGVNKIALPYTGQSYARDSVFEQETPRWKAIRELADSIGYEVYFSGNGYLTMRPYGDPVLSPISWVFRPGKVDGTLVKYSRTANDSRVKNHVIVVGANLTNSLGQTTTVFAEARNDDPQSPTRISRIGDRTDFVKSEFIVSNLQAQSLADQKLRISALEEYNVSFSSLIIPWLNAGDIVDVMTDDEVDYIPKRFLLSSLTFPLGLGPMTGVARRVTIVGTKEALRYY